MPVCTRSLHRSARPCLCLRQLPSPPSIVQQELDIVRRQLAASQQQIADQERLLADQRAIVAQQRQLAEQHQTLAAVHAENARLHAQLALAGASVSVPAATSVSAVDAERLKLGLGSLDNLSSTSEWRDRFSIKTDITVSHIAAVVAALFHGLGSVPLASEYRAFLHALLSLPADSVPRARMSLLMTTCSRPPGRGWRRRSASLPAHRRLPMIVRPIPGLGPSRLPVLSASGGQLTSRP